MITFKDQAQFETLETIANMSPKQRDIAKAFYLWMLSIEKKKMNGLWMRVIYIANFCRCSYDTVIRFLKEYKTLINTVRRRGKTNSYQPLKEFVDAMKLMDKAKMLNKDRRSVKNWLVGMLKSEIKSSYENVKICDPSCSNLRPNPSFILPLKGYKSADEKCVNKILNDLPLTDWQKVKLSSFSEKSLWEAVNDYKWYGQRRVISNPYGLLLNRIRAHT